MLVIPAGFVVIFSEPLLKEGTWPEIFVDLLAWIFFLAGVTFRVWATLYVGSRKFKTLIDQGPYSICRNPLYVGSFLMGLRSALVPESAFFAMAIVLVIMIYVSGTVRAEERALLAQHGELYADYLRRVPRFWPKFSLFTTPPTVEVKINGVRLEAKRLLVWVW